MRRSKKDDIWLSAGFNAPASVAREDPPRVVTHRDPGVPPGHAVSEESGSRPRAKNLFLALRPVHWSKNLLVFVPLIFAHEITDLRRFVACVIGFLAFGLVASATYLLNDLLDLQADRKHPRKRQRALAAGLLSIPISVAVLVGLSGAGISISALALPIAFTQLLGLYVGVAIAYTLVLKRQRFIDVTVLALLYEIRVIAGASAAEVPLSSWLIVFSALLFLSLAFVKRYAELTTAKHQGRLRAYGHAYTIRDMKTVRVLGFVAGYTAVSVLGLYTTSDNAARLYAEPTILWIPVAILLYWITRMWRRAHRAEIDDDPIVATMRDPVSYVSAVLLGLAGLVASA